MKKLLTLILLVFAVGASATHIKGGQIYYKLLGSNTVEFTFIGYRDVQGVPFGQGLFDFGDGEIYGDDPEEVFPWGAIEDLGNGTERWSFTLLHTYAGGGTYKASYLEDFRSAGINNITGSVNTSFYIEAMILLDPLFTTSNASPKLARSSNFQTGLSQQFIQTFAHYDNDGDQLRYKLITPLQERDVAVADYAFPNNSKFTSGEQVQFDLNERTGNLTWDKPSMVGEFTIAIKVEEWREFQGEFILIGYSILDFNITVVDSQESSVSLALPELSCINTNEDFSGSIVISNPSNSELNMQFLTDLEALRINGELVQEWNGSISANSVLDEVIQLNLAVDAASLEAYEGFNNVIFTLNGSSEDSHIDFSANFLISDYCDEPWLVNSIHDDIQFQVYAEGIRVSFESNGRNQILLHSLDGTLLAKSDTKSAAFIDLAYPFEKNTVYLVSVYTSKGVTTKKIVFSN